MQKIHVHNDFDVHLNFTNIKTDYVSRVEFWTRRDDIFCCCKCDGSLKVEDDSNIVCYLNDHNLGTGKLNYNVIFQIPDPNYADGYKKVCQHYVSDIFLTADNGDTTVAIVKVIGGEEVTDLISRLSEFEKVVDGKQDKLAFDNTPTLGSKNVVYSDGIYNAIKNNKPDLSDYAKKSDIPSLEGYVTETELNKKGYLTEHQSLADYAKKSDIPSIEGLATEQWVTDKGYITSIPDDYVTKTELDGKGYLTEHQSLADYAKKTDLPSLEGYVTETELDSKGYLTEHQSLDDYVKKSDPIPRAIATKQWVVQQKYVDELHLDAKVANKVNAIEQWVNDQGYLTSIPDDYVTETELDSKGYLTEHQSLADYAKKSDLKRSTRDMATQYWVNNNYVPKTDFIKIVHTSIETFEPAADTEYTLNSNQYLRIIPADAVKLTFNKSSDGATGIMREYHILIDCKTAVPTTEFKGVLWELDNEPVFEKGKLYDIVIRDYETNLFGSWKAYKLMGITILITTSDATDVQLNANTYNLVAGDNSLTNADLKTITDIDGFNGNDKITSIDFGSATIKTADLNSKFSGMLNLTKISNITIKDAVNFSSMFLGCNSLTSVDLSHWDTSNATDFSYMFHSCKSLTTLDVSKWDVSKATDFSGMFAVCSALTSLNVLNWDVSKGTDFSSMFMGCSGLTSLNVSRWNTSSANSFGSMFNGCSGLKTLDLSGWNVSSATNFSNMFSYSGLTTLDLSNWDVGNAANFVGMFDDCSALTSLKMSGWNTSSANDFGWMFADCNSLTALDVSKWDVGNASSFNSMFSGCSALTTLDLSGWNISTKASVTDMFKDCDFLTTIRMVGCPSATIDKINSVKPASATIITE